MAKISLLTDAPKHNIALMKLSAWHKAQGDTVTLNEPLFHADYSYASILFDWNKKMYRADEYGGPAFCENSTGPQLPMEIEAVFPDYNLYGGGISIGFTFRPCHRGCSFCRVKHIGGDTEHRSIWDFHDPAHKEICLLNNNTFFDRRWRETFEEIWDAGLAVRDENGYDLRLLDDEKADALHRTKWSTPLHFAWDRMRDEAEVVRGLKLLGKHHLRSTSHGVYVLIGYDTTEEEDLHRCQVIHDHGLTPYPMPYEKNDYTRRFKRFINLHAYRQHRTIEAAWREYAPGRRQEVDDPMQILMFDGDGYGKLRAGG